MKNLIFLLIVASAIVSCSKEHDLKGEWSRQNIVLNNNSLVSNSSNSIVNITKRGRNRSYSVTGGHTYDYRFYEENGLEFLELTAVSWFSGGGVSTYQVTEMTKNSFTMEREAIDIFGDNITVTYIHSRN